MFISKKCKKLLSIALACVMLAMVSITGLRSVQFANADEISFSMDGLIAITVFENEGEIFTALVPEENVE